MLYVTRPIGKQVLIGDHSVVTVVSVDQTNYQVKLGLETLSRVQRVDTPEMVLEAARVKARLTRVMKRGEDEPMHRAPVYVAHVAGDDSLEIKAALSWDKAQYPGATTIGVTDLTEEGPAHHEFVVVRSLSPREADALKLLVAKALDWVFLDQNEQPDATVHQLFVRTVGLGEKRGDVRYVDTTT